jgi:hypothetical protein
VRCAAKGTHSTDDEHDADGGDGCHTPGRQKSKQAKGFEDKERDNAFAGEVRDTG